MNYNSSIHRFTDSPIKRILFIITFLAATVSGFAQDDIFKRPAKQSLVVDNANVFNEQQRTALTLKLNKFDQETSTQILVYTTNSLYGYSIADFGQRLGKGWGVGQKGFDNGIVIVYKGKTATSNGQVTIQTGYGIEPLIPDAICKLIIEQEMIPRFREGLVYEGINAAVDKCMALTKGHFHRSRFMVFKRNTGSFFLALLILLGTLFLLIFILAKVLDDNYTASGGSSVGRRGGFGGGGFGGFGGGGGGFGGGGFGGFGGGGFGGGGACGGW